MRDRGQIVCVCVCTGVCARACCVRMCRVYRWSVHEDARQCAQITGAVSARASYLVHKGREDVGEGFSDRSPPHTPFCPPLVPLCAPVLATHTRSYTLAVSHSRARRHTLTHTVADICAQCFEMAHRDMTLHVSAGPVGDFFSSLVNREPWMVMGGGG